MITTINEWRRHNEASGRAAWEGELNAEQAKMWGAIKYELDGLESDPGLEVEHTEDFGVEPNQIQLDLTLEGDGEDEYDVVSVLVTMDGDTYKVEQWTQMFSGGGGEDTTTTTTVGLSLGDCARLAAGYLRNAQSVGESAKPWYVEQGEEQARQARQSAQNRSLLEEAVEILRQNGKVHDVSEIYESTHTGHAGYHYSVQFRYEHPGGTWHGKFPTIGLEVRDGAFLKQVMGAMYDLNTSDPAKAVEDLLAYVDKVPVNRLVP